jgi:hypothetical protein
MTDDNYFDSEKHYREAVEGGHIRPAPPVEPPKLPDPPRKERKFDFSSHLTCQESVCITGTMMGRVSDQPAPAKERRPNPALLALGVVSYEEE